MESTTIWKPRKFKYDLVLQTRRPLAEVTFGQFHPLKQITVMDTSSVKAGSTSKRSVKPKKDMIRKPDSAFVDPLSAMTLSDPLSTLVVNKNILTNIDPKDEKTEMHKTNVEYGNDFEPWSSRKLKILSKYTTNDKLSVAMTSMSKGESHQGLRRHQANSTISDKLKDRLGQLDDFEEGGVIEMQNLSQQEFVDKMHQLNKTLTEAWNTNQKVKSLKIAIQCAKLLGDVSVIQFYPSKFVLVTDLLDTFGLLVFERILSLCKGMSADNIVSEDVPESAKEICVNWMLKISSIRELLPRIFVEASIVHCSQFLSDRESKAVLNRLTSMACGVGDPLVAVYLRAYLCQIGVTHTPKYKGHLKANFYNFLETYKQIHTHSVQNKMASQKLDMSVYLDHFTPSLEWILSCLAHNASEATLTEVLERCRKAGYSLMLLDCCLFAFNSEFISTRALRLCDLINQLEDDVFSREKVLVTLANKVVKSAPPEDDRLPLLNEVWKVLMKIRDPKKYITCAEAWIEFAAKHFTKKEIDTILADIIKHMTPDREFEKHYNKLTSVVSKILLYITNFSELFSMEKLLPFLDMFQNESYKVKVCKLVAQSFISIQDTFTSDPIVVNGLMYICKILHDSINALSIDDDKKMTGALISAVVLKVSFGKDFEQQLSFYVECRASFHGLDCVLITLIHAVNALSANVTKIVKVNHTRKTSSFVRACTAYSFITIPSLTNIYNRLLLYMESGQVALISQCITQADAMYKSAISMIIDLLALSEKRTVWTQQMLLNFIASFLSNLLLVPDNPEQGVLYLLRGLLNVVSNTEISNFGQTKCLIYTKVLSILTAFSQNQYIYHVDKVDSNDNLYNTDPKFINEINKISSTLLDEILGYLYSTTNPQDCNHQSLCAFQLFEVVVAHGDLSDERMQHLAIAVWTLILKYGLNDTKRMVSLWDYLKNKGGIYHKLSTALPLQSRA